MDCCCFLLFFLVCLSFWFGGCVVGGDLCCLIFIMLILVKVLMGQLVVVLFGCGDNFDLFMCMGIVQIIQQKWFGVDVMLIGLIMFYYCQGQVIVCLYGEIMVFVCECYWQVWLVGIFLGGLGVLLYDQVYLDEVVGLLLFLFYFGDCVIYWEICMVGGFDVWQFGLL